jgi:hypothetical protein
MHSKFNYKRTFPRIDLPRVFVASGLPTKTVYRFLTSLVLVKTVNFEEIVPVYAVNHRKGIIKNSK